MRKHLLFLFSLLHSSYRIGMIPRLTASHILRLTVYTHHLRMGFLISLSDSPFIMDLRMLTSD
jgi:hypothetical protein